MRKKGSNPEWNALTVVFVDAAGKTVELAGERLKFGETVLGLSDITKWKRRLKQQIAARRAEPLEDARAQDSDVVCGR
ncbi:MAG: hypothetical protein ABI895_37110 [Deltaproteobacteria bacterium]